MTNMNKELVLEEWLNVEESAKYLSGLIDGTVQESNIYRYACNNRLVLSLMFDSYQIGDIGTFEQCSEGNRLIDNENICFKFDAIVLIEGIKDIVNKAKGRTCIFYLYRVKSDSSFSKPDYEKQSTQDSAIYLADPYGSSAIWELNANKSLDKAKDLPNDAVIVVKRDRLNELASSINDKFTDDLIGDEALIYDTNNEIQLLANKTAKKLVQNGLKNPTKAKVANDIFEQGIVMKKHGDLADYDYILRRFKVSWKK